MNSTIMTAESISAMKTRDNIILERRSLSMNARGVYCWLYAMGLLVSINMPAINKAMKYEFGQTTDSPAWQGYFELIDNKILPK